ncbi:MAG TPA: YcxB family protein [Acidobacteriaceae bacterium]
MLREEGVSLFILALLGLFFLFLIWLQPRLTARKAILRTVEWRFSDEGIHIQSDVASSDILWKAFIRFREGPKVLLLYTQKGQANFIPKRALDASQLDELRTLIGAHVAVHK